MMNRDALGAWPPLFAVAGMAAALILSSCHGARRSDTGIEFLPAPAGDSTEVGIEKILRDATGIHMGMRQGDAIDEILERAPGKFSGQPTSGGVTSLRLGQGVYFALYSYALPSDLSQISVCGYSFRTSTGEPPPIIPVDRIRAELAADPATQKVGTALYRKTGKRAISLYENAFFYVDTVRCSRRDPGLPEEF